MNNEQGTHPTRTTENSQSTNIIDETTSSHGNLGSVQNSRDLGSNSEASAGQLSARLGGKAEEQEGGAGAVGSEGDAHEEAAKRQP